MHQTWLDLLFAHWPVSPAAMRSLVPPQLSLDTFDRQCWIGIVPFDMQNIHAHLLPPILGLSHTEELNVRTYVTYGGRPGVYFFSLDAASLAVVLAARAFFDLPYFHAQMKIERRADAVHYASRRYRSSAEFRGSYRPVGEVRPATAGTLEYFLTERYCLYVIHRRTLYRCDIHHPPWPLQNAEVSIEHNTMADAAGLTLPSTPALAHFSRRQEVLVWPLREVAKERL